MPQRISARFKVNFGIAFRSKVVGFSTKRTFISETTVKSSRLNVFVLLLVQNHLECKAVTA